MTFSLTWIGFAVLMAVAMVTDFRTYRIPNAISLALLALFGLAAAFTPDPVSLWPHLAVGAGALAVGYILYLTTGMGAGDAKLFAAAALWAGPAGGYALTLNVAFGMVVLAITLVLVRFVLSAVLSEQTGRMRVFQKGAPAPLGVAIGAGSIAASAHFQSSLFAF